VTTTVGWEDSWLNQLYEKRVRQNRDLVVIISDWGNERGTGKTTLSLKLADEFDRTEDGVTPEKCTTYPEVLHENYTGMPSKSALVFDEAEAGASKYEASSAVNRALRETVSIGRREEKYLILSAPAADQIDADLKSLADAWVLVRRRGHAVVYSFEVNPHEGYTYQKKRDELRWNDFDEDSYLLEAYDSIEEEKKERLDGQQEKFVQYDDASEEFERRLREARKDVRDAVISRMVNEADMRQKDVSHLLPEEIRVSRSAVSKIADESDGSVPEVDDYPFDP